ncbi:MAG: nucleotide sugar dehydrogenase [Pseudomonadota bacterium]
MSEDTSRSGGPAAELRDRISAKSAVVGIIGMGYVGLPLAVASYEGGYPVVGFDINPATVDGLNAGRSHIGRILDDQLAAMSASGRFEATTEFSELARCDIVIICVPTPLSRHREPDLSFVENSVRVIARYLRAGQLISLESTTYPGTTREVSKPILEQTGLQSGVDFFLAYSPEREDPGNPIYDTASIPKVVGGDGADAIELAAMFYQSVVSAVVPVSSCETAEAVKLTENIFRSVNIALVNELKTIYGEMGINVWEVIDAAKTKPFGYMAFYPGPGLGGHCIPIDPFYLTWKAREYGLSTRFIELAGEINTVQPAKVVTRLGEALGQRFRKSLAGSRILLIGLAYKKNVEDVRESPAFALIELIQQHGGEVEYYDPHVPVVPPTREHGELAGKKSVDWNPSAFGDYDAALICTDHDAVDWTALASGARLIVDTRNALKDIPERGNIVMA